jgi:hypothetical protein
MVAEEDGSAVHPFPPSHECHCPVGSTSVGPSMYKQEVCEVKSLEGAPSRRVGVCQVLDARHHCGSAKTNTKGTMDHQSPSCEAPSSARAKAKLWTKFQALQKKMDSFRRKKICGQETFQ